MNNFQKLLSFAGRNVAVNFKRVPQRINIVRMNSAAVSLKPEIPEEKIPVSTPIGHDKNYDKKITKLVDEISQLTLLEVAELNALLKKTLNIPDAPMMGSFPMGGFAPQAKEEEEEIAPVKVQTNFTVKLLKFDDTKKVALIKEIKTLIEGMNLVQAKKFVESAPTVVKADIPKEEAEKLMACLTALGASCEIV